MFGCYPANKILFLSQTKFSRFNKTFVVRTKIWLVQQQFFFGWIATKHIVASPHSFLSAFFLEYQIMIYHFEDKNFSLNSMVEPTKILLINPNLFLSETDKNFFPSFESPLCYS